MQSLKAQNREERSVTTDVAEKVEHRLDSSDDDDFDDLDEASRAKLDRELEESVKELESGRFVGGATHIAELRARSESARARRDMTDVAEKVEHQLDDTDDDSDDLDEASREELHRELEESFKEAEAGLFVDAGDLMAELRAISASARYAKSGT